MYSATLIEKLKSHRATLFEKVTTFQKELHACVETNKGLEGNISKLESELSASNDTFKKMNAGSKKIDEIWNVQKPAHDKKGLGYEETTKIHQTKFVPATQGNTTTINVENSKNKQVVK